MAGTTHLPLCSLTLTEYRRVSTRNSSSGAEIERLAKIVDLGGIPTGPVTVDRVVPLVEVAQFVFPPDPGRARQDVGCQGMVISRLLPRLRMTDLGAVGGGILRHRREGVSAGQDEDRLG